MYHFSFESHLSWKSRGLRRCLLTIVFVSGGLFLHLALPAQVAHKVTIPGTAFSPEPYDKKKVTVEDKTRGSRSFRAQGFDPVKLRAEFPLPPASSVAEYKIQRLVVHFSSVRDGPSLRTVELRSGSALVWKMNMNVAGDYTTRETEYPKPGANTWVSDAMKVYPKSWLRLEIQFPNGFDETLKPAPEFIIVAVEAWFPGKAKDIGRKPIGAPKPPRFPIKPKDTVKPKDIPIRPRT